MLVMKSEPAVTVIPVTDETEVVDLDQPHSGLLFSVLIHRHKFKECIITLQEIKKVSDNSRILHYLCTLTALVVE